MAKDRLTNTVKTIMPAKNEINGLLYRSVLYHLVDKSKKDFRWIVPKISENCTFCGVCETLCPQKAIHVDKESKQIRLDLWKCSACETCKNTCMNHGINEMDILEIHSLKPIILHERSKL